jgi:hypothetical protein
MISCDQAHRPGIKSHMKQHDLEIYARKWLEELRKALPWREAIPHEELILSRFVRSLFFKDATVRIVEAGHNNTEWHDFNWVSQARRDRSDGKLRYLCTRKEAWTLLDDACSLAYNLHEIGVLIGIPKNPYKDDDSSLPPWTAVSETPLRDPATLT